MSADELKVKGLADTPICDRSGPGREWNCFPAIIACGRSRCKRRQGLPPAAGRRRLPVAPPATAWLCPTPRARGSFMVHYPHCMV